MIICELEAKEGYSRSLATFIRRVNRLETVQIALFDCQKNYMVIKTVKKPLVIQRLVNQLITMAKKEGFKVTLKLVREKKHHGSNPRNFRNGGKPKLRLI